MAAKERETDASWWLVTAPLLFLVATFLAATSLVGSINYPLAAALALPLWYTLCSLRFGDCENAVPPGSSLLLGHLPQLMEVVEQGKSTGFGMHDWFAMHAQRHDGLVGIFSKSAWMKDPKSKPGSGWAATLEKLSLGDSFVTTDVD